MEKKYVKIISVMVVISFIFFITVGIGLLKNKKNYDYMVINERLIISKKSNRWAVKKKNMNNYSWNFYNVYLNHEYFGNEYLFFNDQIYLFDKDKNALNYTGDFIAFNKDEYKDINIKTINSKETEILEKILSKNGLSIKQSFTSNYYIDIDIDNDSQMEQFYVVSNRFPIENINTNKYFGFIYFVDNNKASIIYDDIQNTNNGFSGCKPYIRNIVSYKSVYYIITECSTYSDGVKTIAIYEYKNGKFDKKISTIY